MTRPAVGNVGESLYASMAPIAIATDDEGRDWPLLKFCGAITSGLEQAHTYIADNADGPGWRSVLDPWTAPEAALPYLAQFTGVTLEPALTVEQQRSKIALPENLARGTVAAMVAAAQRTLTGAKSVSIGERYGGNAYQLFVRTNADETPDEAATRAALLTQKPAGIVMDYDVVTGQAWSDVEATYDDWADVVAQLP